MNLFGLAVRNLRRRPMRTSLSIVGIALAVGSALALIALSRSIEDSTRQGLDEQGAALLVTQRNASDLFGGFLPEGLEARIAEIPGVAHVGGELLMFAPSDGDRQVLTAGWADTGYLWKTVPVGEGRLPEAHERKVALLGDLAAAALGKKLGDPIEILGEEFRIVGITKYSAVINRGLLIVPLADLQEAAYRPGQVTTFHVTLQGGAHGDEVERIKQGIVALGRLSISTTSEVLQNDRNFALLNAVSVSISIIALSMGILNVLNTLLMTIQERTREIGIVAAIGWSDARIMTSIVIEGEVMCAVGCAIGVALGYAASLTFHAIPTIGNYIDFVPGVGLIVPTLAAALALCLIGSLYPAWRAIRMTPAQALQRA